MARCDEDLAHAGLPVGEQFAQLAGHGYSVLLGAGDDCDSLDKGGVELLQAPPQWAGDLPHSDGAAVLGQRHLEVRPAHVVAGCNGHGTSAGFPASRAVLHEGRAEGQASMDVIPVIDVRHGLAVAAMRGQRADYRPLVTPLAAGSQPGGHRTRLRRAIYLSGALRRRSRWHRGQGTQRRPAGASLQQPCPMRAFGSTTAHRRRRLRSASREEQNATLVIGTETLGGDHDVVALRSLPTDRYVLSLDFKGDRFDGPAAVLDEPQHWPHAVIVMTLARVGSGEGPDLARIATIVGRAGNRRVYAAGGVRNRADIEALHAAGASGVLIATALHAGTIKAGDLKEIAGL